MRVDATDIELRAGEAVAIVAPSAGGRLRSLRVGGRELLVTNGAGPYAWGSFPMVPYAGRLRNGRLLFRGTWYQLPITMPPHAIHGTLAEAAWDVVGEPAPDRARLTARLADPWPFGGRVEQAFRLQGSALRVEMELDAHEPMAASMGWHPWFARHVDGAGELELDVRPGRMLRRDAQDIPTGELVDPAPRPWDDTFTDLQVPAKVRWPGFLELTLESACRYWVVYDEQPAGVCIEPQTAPPDALNWMPESDVLVAPGRPLRAAMTLRWGPA
jgi:aldose 1-epimerase